MPDGTPVDIILNARCARRMNIGQILETHLGWVAKSSWNIDVVGAPRWAANLPEGLLSAGPESIVSTPVFDGAREASWRVCGSTLPNRDGEVMVLPGKSRLFDGRGSEPFRTRSRSATCTS